MERILRLRNKMILNRNVPNTKIGMPEIMDTFYNIHSEEKYCFIYEFIDYFNEKCEKNGIDYRLSINDDGYMVINADGEEVVTDLQVFKKIHDLNNKEVILKRILKLNDVSIVEPRGKVPYYNKERYRGLSKFIEDIYNKRAKIATKYYSIQDEARLEENMSIIPKRMERAKHEYIGGFLESKNNLDNRLNLSFVYDFACVYNNARIYEDATLFDHAQVCDNASACGKVIILNNAMVYDNACIFDHASILESTRVFGNAEVCHGISHGKNIQVFGNAKVKCDGLCHNILQVFGDIELTVNNYSVFERSLVAKTIPELMNISHRTGNYDFVFNGISRCFFEGKTELVGEMMQSIDGENSGFIASAFRGTDEYHHEMIDIFLHGIPKLFCYHRPKTTIQERLLKIIGERRQFDIIVELILNKVNYGEKRSLIGEFTKFFNVYNEDRRIYPEKWVNEQDNADVFNALSRKYLRANCLENTPLGNDLKRYLDLDTIGLFKEFLEVLNNSKHLIRDSNDIVIKEGVVIYKESNIHALKGITLERGAVVRGSYLFPYKITIDYPVMCDDVKARMIFGRGTPTSRSRIFLECGKNNSINSMARYAIFNYNRYVDKVQILPLEVLAENDTTKRYLGGVVQRERGFESFKEDIDMLARNYDLLQNIQWGRELLDRQGDPYQLTFDKKRIRQKLMLNRQGYPKELIFNRKRNPRITFNKKQNPQKLTWRERIENYRKANKKDEGRE